MTDVSPTAEKRSWLPQLKSRWWTALLGLSLMLNLLVGGIVFGGAFVGGRMERLTGASYVQLIPRNFFRELSAERRKAIMQIVRENRDDLKSLRDASEASSVKLAEVLEQDAFNIEGVKTAVASFTTGTGSLAARGGDVVVKIVAQLTPDERKALAKSIRQRAERSNKKAKTP
jgi:uncharacterized membrane protein